jgi:gamma-glutamylputrescine oxidase
VTALAALSPWLEEADPAEPALAGERVVDVAIVGAGYTGLSTALALRREGLSVAVLEARRAGFGASGRNAGHLTPTIGKDLPTLSKTWGRERVDGLVTLVRAAIGHVEASISKHAIACDYEPVGNVVAAVHERQHRAVERAAEAARTHHMPGELLERADLERRGLPRFVTRGWLEAEGGILHPGRYLGGLRRAALAAGAELYEETPVLRIEEGEDVVVHAAHGRVRAERVVLATNAFTPELGRLRSAGTRLHVQLFRTAPLDDAQRAALGWTGREGIYTAHEILESYRWTPDGRILGGSKAVRAGFAGRSLPDVDPAVSTLLERTFRQRFPELPGLPIERHWGGPIYMSLDFLPVVGRGGRGGRVLHALAYAGHGVALASYAGEMLADLILERDGPGRALVDRRFLPTPPEPLRWLAFHALRGWFAAADRRVDALVAREPR